MSDYIEREAAIERLAKLMQLQPSTARAIIEAIPAADVRPVVRGKWEPVVAANEDGSPYQAGIRCSECGHFDVLEFNYCPNCGADMREGNDGI